MREKILELRSQGLTYNEISKQLGCAKSTVSYHCAEGQKEKSLLRTQKFKKSNILLNKIYKFKERKNKPARLTKESSRDRGITEKVRCFQRRIGSKLGPSQSNFGVKEVLDLHGVQPICYLTGDKIDLSTPSSYSLDHIVPASKGGTNELTNLGFLTKNANIAKSDMSIEEFLELCVKVLVHWEIIETTTNNS